MLRLRVLPLELLYAHEVMTGNRDADLNKTPFTYQYQVFFWQRLFKDNFTVPYKLYFV